MKWSTDSPTEAGWYWFLNTNRDDAPTIKYIRWYAGGLCETNWAIQIGPGIKWAGPIPLPLDENDLDNDNFCHDWFHL